MRTKLLSALRQKLLCALVVGSAGLFATSPAAGSAPHPTTTTLSAEPGSAALGTVFTFTATVTVGGAPVTAGSVQFNDGKRILGTTQVIISGPSVGTAVLKTSSFSAGSHSVTASYSGAPQSAQSTASSASAPAVITVTGLAPTFTSLLALPSTVQPLAYDLTASLVAAGSVPPSGTLTVNELGTGSILGTTAVSTTGGFQPAQLLSGGTGYNSYFIFVVLADLNGDGVLDMVLLTDDLFSDQGPNNLIVQFGDPKHPGQFLPPVIYTLTAPAEWIAVGDVNGDGLPDLVVGPSGSPSGTGQVGLLLNDASHPGQLEPEQAIADIASISGQGFLADLNGDGVLDLVVAIPSDVAVSFGDPAHPGQFLPVQHLSLNLGADASIFGIADFNQDGLPDLGVVNSTNSGTGLVTNISIYLGEPAHPGQFTPGGTYSGDIGAELGDFNGDGLPDIFSFSVLLLNDAAHPGTFSSVSTNFPSSNGNSYTPYSALVADVNGDGVSDIIGLTQTCDEYCYPLKIQAMATVFLSEPGNPGQFIASTVSYPFGVFAFGSAAVGDVNGDGQPDFVAVSLNSVSDSYPGIVKMLGTQVASLTFNNTPVPGNGISSVQVSYSGDARYQASSSTTVIESSSLQTTTQLTSLSTSVAEGSPITFTATVQAAQGTPPGSFSFSDGASVLCTIAPNNAGQATCATTLSGVGAHSIQAGYSGSAPYLPSQSNALVVMVTGGVGTASLTASPNPIPAAPGILLGTTTIQWSAPSAQAVEIHVGSPTGTLFAGGGNTGSSSTGAWVTEGMSFYLQDTTGGKPLTAANTLAVLVVHVGQEDALTASPNPILVSAGSLLGRTTIQWNDPSAQFVEVHVGSPTGTLFAAGTGTGSAATGEWVTDGLTFYLQNVSGGAPLTPPNTVATLVMHVQDPPFLLASPNPVASLGCGLATTMIQWNAPLGTAVEIHVGAPDGTLFAEGGNTGSSSTGNWVTNGERFYLQDVTGGKPLTSANTLAVLIVTLSN